MNIISIVMRRMGPDSLLKLLDGAKGLVHSLVSPLRSLPDRHHHSDDDDVICDRDDNVEDADHDEEGGW